MGSDYHAEVIELGTSHPSSPLTKKRHAVQIQVGIVGNRISGTVEKQLTS